jgi:hypothetical protein
MKSSKPNSLIGVRLAEACRSNYQGKNEGFTAARKIFFAPGGDV